jgi:PAS domain S-box-containing protein
MQVLVLARFQEFLDAAPDAMVVVGCDGRIVAANIHAHALFGYLTTELIGQPIEMLVPVRLRDRHVAHRESHSTDQATQLRTIQTSAKFPLSLINDLLDLAKLESGKVEIEFELEQFETTSAQRHEGSGLGLHLSQKLAELLGAEIACDSEFGRGSVFTLSLPAGDGHGTTTV